MLLSLIIVYAVSLLYLSVAERFRHYAWLVGLQGWLLMGIALMQLTPAAGTGTTIFILAETAICKGILVPYMLFRIIRSTRINRVSRVAMPGFVAILISVVALLASLSVTRLVADTTVNTLFFSISLFGLLCGLILITTHQRIFSHLVGFLIIENAVFFFSLAVGFEMPMLVSIGILLDILMGVLMLGLFITKIGRHLPDLDNEELSQMRD